MSSFTHHSTVEQAVQDKSLIRTHAFIGSAWIQTQKKFPVTDPATGKAIAHVADVGRDQILTAIAYADAEFQKFRKTSEYERAALLRNWATMVRRHKNDLARILTMENGKVLVDALGEVESGASFLDWFAEEAIRSYGDIIASRIPGRTNLTMRQPIGVCGIIAPWNFPLSMVTRKLAPAVAAGCTSVIKPPREAPLCTLAMVQLAHQAGIPAGVLQVVPTSDRQAVEELYTHPAIKKISFTGSTSVGKYITAKAAGTMKHAAMELGGLAPFIVFDDADLPAAVAGAIGCKFRCSGQTCICANRFYVQSGIHDKFVAAVAECMRSFKIGPGLDPAVTHGPVINHAAVDKVRSHIDDALRKGARLLVGGKPRPELGGFFIEPALLDGVTQDMEVAHDETFGPLAAVIRFDTVDEVISVANDTEYGLAGYFFSRDVKRIWHVAQALEVGMVGVNTGSISAAEAPFGGIKQSGQGKEGSKYGLAEYQIIKNVVLGGLA